MLFFENSLPFSEEFAQEKSVLPNSDMIIKCFGYPSNARLYEKVYFIYAKRPTVTKITEVKMHLEKAINVLGAILNVQNLLGYTEIKCTEMNARKMTPLPKINLCSPHLTQMKRS